MKLDTTPIVNDPPLHHADVLKGCRNCLDDISHSLENDFGDLCAIIHHWNKHQGFWACGNTGEKIALMHSELSEALEADRKDLMSDHIPEFTGVEEELADVMIRIFDFAGRHGLHLSGALLAKLEFNFMRPPMHGKKY